jgi:hypothetical protein
MTGSAVAVQKLYIVLTMSVTCASTVLPPGMHQTLITASVFVT